MSKQAAFDKLSLLGVEVDCVSVADAITYLVDRAGPDQPSGYVIKPYVEFLDRAYHNSEITELLNNAELSLADGVALMWAAAFLYAGPRSLRRFWLTLFQIVLAPHELRWPLPDRAAGVNFTWPLLESAAARGRTVFLIGDPINSNKGHDITATARFISQKLPNLRIVGTLSGRDPSRPRGQISPEWLERAAATITAATPDIILTGAGFPLQEGINAHLAEHVKHGIFIAEGGTFDFESFGGSLQKAPDWMQRLGLEWVWRLILQPKRISRQLAIPRFIYRIWQYR